MFIEHLLCIKHYSRHGGNKIKFFTPWSLHCCETLCPQTSSCNIPTDSSKIQPGRRSSLHYQPGPGVQPPVPCAPRPQLVAVGNRAWVWSRVPSPHKTRRALLVAREMVTHRWASQSPAAVKGAEVSNSDQNVKRQAGEVGEEEER